MLRQFNSQVLKVKLKTRTIVERTNKCMLEIYALDHYDYGARSTMIKAALATFAAVNIDLEPG
jgi:hypothetical protein